MFKTTFSGHNKISGGTNNLERSGALRLNAPRGYGFARK